MSNYQDAVGTYKSESRRNATTAESMAMDRAYTKKMDRAHTKKIWKTGTREEYFRTNETKTAYNNEKKVAGIIRNYPEYCKNNSQEQSKRENNFNGSMNIWSTRNEDDQINNTKSNIVYSILLQFISEMATCNSKLFKYLKKYIKYGWKQVSW